MELKLNRPLCFFDLETTGIDIARDRIVEISVCKLSPDSSRQVRTWLVNPGRPIPKAVSDIHGITDEKVKDAPRFEQIAPVVYEMIRDSDLAGYNSNRFDIPMLAEELLRAGIDFDMGNRVAVDVQAIFYKKEPRTLSAAYKFYCGAELEGAHAARPLSRSAQRCARPFGIFRSAPYGGFCRFYRVRRRWGRDLHFRQVQGLQGSPGAGERSGLYGMDPGEGFSVVHQAGDYGTAPAQQVLQGGKIQRGKIIYVSSPFRFSFQGGGGGKKSIKKMKGRSFFPGGVQGTAAKAVKIC